MSTSQDHHAVIDRGVSKPQYMFQIEPLKEQDLGCATSLLFESYHDDPLFMEIFHADKADYDKRLRTAIRQELHSFWQDKEATIGLFVDQQLLGVACVVCPDFGMNAGRSWHWRLKMLLTAGLVSTRQMIAKEEKVKSSMPVKRYHMLGFMAVHPNHQKYGLGNHLMKAVDDIVEADVSSGGIGVYVTLDKYHQFFNSDNYQKVADINVGYVHGELWFRAN